MEKNKKLAAPLHFFAHEREMQKAWVPPNIISLPSLSSQPTSPQLLSPLFLISSLPNTM